MFSYGTGFIEQTIYVGKVITGWDSYGCTPSCGTNICGSNGCGGSCGSCPSGAVCISGQCTPTGCTPQCAGKSCGDDGCGGDCGSCEGGEPGSCTSVACINGDCVTNYEIRCKKCSDSEDDFVLERRGQSGDNPWRHGVTTLTTYLDKEGNSKKTSEGDYCEGDSLKEYYCNNVNSMGEKDYSCEFGCDNGRCLTCGDSDSPPNPNWIELLTSYDIFGNVQETGYNYHNSGQDTCLSSDSPWGFEYESASGNKLLEFYCGWGDSNLVIILATVLCECEGGKCSSAEISSIICGDGSCDVDSETCTNCESDCGVCPLYCGDGTCNADGGEFCYNCPQDCESCLRICGDLICNGDETCESCPQDCGNGGSCADQFCGDENCNGDEDCESCRDDCGICAPVCGDGSCNGIEDCSVCAQDCGTCGTSCGDGTCDANENCLSCSTDCGVCSLGCGDGICNEVNYESCTTCAADCGTCGTSCGDGNCDSNEDCLSCSTDCNECTSGCGDDVCNVDENSASCADDCGDVIDDRYCGNGKCDSNENCFICSKDCGICPESELVKIIEKRISQKIIKGTDINPDEDDEGGLSNLLDKGGLSNLLDKESYLNSGTLTKVFAGILAVSLLIIGFLLYWYLKKRK